MGARLGKCVYDPAAKKAKVQRIIETGRFKKLQDKDFNLYLLGRVLSIAPFFKHESFKEEKEWRVALTGGRNAVFREGETSIIPYIEFDLQDESGTLPIDNIVVGPTPNMSESLYSCKQLLEKHEIKAHIRESSIPYRPTI